MNKNASSYLVAQSYVVESCYIHFQNSGINNWKLTWTGFPMSRSKHWVKVNTQLYVEVSYPKHFHNTGFNICSELNNDKHSKVKLFFFQKVAISTSWELTQTYRGNVTATRLMVKSAYTCHVAQLWGRELLYPSLQTACWLLYKLRIDLDFSISRS